MDITIIVRKGEIFVKRWMTETRSYEEKRKTEQTLSDVLQCEVLLEDTTFGQFFDLIAREKELFEKIFSASMYGHPLEPYLKEASLPAKPSMDLDYVHVFWCAEIFEGEMEVYAGFSGWGSWSNTVPTEKGGIAIEFTALNEYKDEPFRLDTECQIWDWDAKKELLKKSIGERLKMFLNGLSYMITGLEPFKQRPTKATLEFKVYDVINAILNEITWAGDISGGREEPEWSGDKKAEAA